MKELPGTQRTDLSHYWPETVKNFLAYQWELFEGPYRVGLTMMERALSLPLALTSQSGSSDQPGGQAAPTLEEKARRLECQAVERVKQGFAPPKEIYEAHFRKLINWEAFPEWARPTDPEQFSNCGHEG